MKILVAEDDPSLRRALVSILQKNRCCVDAVDNGRDALDYLRSDLYDAAILDIMMPLMDGVSVLIRAREAGHATPVLLLTAKSGIDDKIAGLDAGANDYLTKPFDMRELLARLRALTRRQDDRQGHRLSCGNTVLDTRSFELSAPGGSYRLAGKEYQLSVAALLVLQTLIVGFSIAGSYRRMAAEADRIILLADTAPDSPELGDARYFRVSYSPGEGSVEMDLSHTSLVTRDAAAEYAREVIASRSDSGYADGYRYLVRRGRVGVRITFLSRFEALDAFRDNARTLLLISLCGIAAMAAALAAVSGRVVAPLVESRRRQKEFITSASHELKTPLTVIRADAQLLESEIGENEWLSDILKQTAGMAEMTGRLVYLSRAEEQEDAFVKIVFPVSDVAEEVAQSYRSVAESSGRAYAVEIREGLSCRGDERAIRELMAALLDNAFRYSPAGGDVSVRLDAEGHGVRFTVENTASGIEPEQLERLAERFYRADVSGGSEGFGLGLSIVRAIAAAHGGKLTMELPEEGRIRISATLK